jgi:hypothetical protein
VLVGRLSPPGRPTPFTRLGDWPGVVAVALVIGFALVRRGRGAGTVRAAR